MKISLLRSRARAFARLFMCTMCAHHTLYCDVQSKSFWRNGIARGFLCGRQMLSEFFFSHRLTRQLNCEE